MTMTRFCQNVESIQIKQDAEWIKSRGSEQMQKTAQILNDLIATEFWFTIESINEWYRHLKYT